MTITSPLGGKLRASQQVPCHGSDRGRVPAPVFAACSAERPPAHSLRRLVSEPPTARTVTALSDVAGRHVRACCLKRYRDRCLAVSALRQPNACRGAANCPTDPAGATVPGLPS